MDSVRVEIEVGKIWVPLALTFENSDDAVHQARFISMTGQLSTRVVRPSQKNQEGVVDLLASFKWKMEESSYGYNGASVKDVTVVR